MSAIDEPPIAPTRAVAADPSRHPRALAQDPALGGDRRLGIRRHLPHGDRRFAFNRELLLLYICHRPAGCQHRSGPPHALRHPRLAAVRPGAARLRPQQGSGRPRRPADAVAVAGRRRPLVVLRDDADGVAAGAPQVARRAVVGSRAQHRLHVVLHPSVHRRGGAVAA